MISRGFIKSSLIYTIAGTLPMASAVILLPFYIHYLSTATLGAMWIYLAFSILVQILVTFSLDSSIYIYYHEFKKDEKTLSSFISSAFVLIVIIGSSVALIFTLTGHYLFALVYKNNIIAFFPYGLISVFIGVFQSIFKVYCSLLQTRQKPTLFFQSNLLSFALIAGLTILGLKLYPGSLIGPLGGRLTAALVSGGLAFFKVVREYGFSFNYPLLRSSFSFNFYSYIYQLQQWTVNYFDRIVISFFLPLSEVGIYGFAVSCLIVVEFAVNGLYGSFAPRIIGIIVEQTDKGSTQEINRYFNGLTVASMVLVSLCILVFPVLIDIFISKPEYRLSIQYIPFVGIIYLFKSMRLYFGIPYGILKYTKPLPFIYLAVACIKIGAMFVLIKHVGIYGVILSSLLSYWVEVLLLYRNGNSRFNFKFNTFKILIAPIALSLLIGTMQFFVTEANSIYLHAFYFIASLVLVAWAFRNEIGLIRQMKILR